MFQEIPSQANDLCCLWLTVHVVNFSCMFFLHFTPLKQKVKMVNLASVLTLCVFVRVVLIRYCQFAHIMPDWKRGHSHRVIVILATVFLHIINNSNYFTR